jgi:hypothetical protein
MSIKSIAAKLFAKYIHYQDQKWIKQPIQTQQKVFEQLIQQAKHTAFGKDHDFDNISSIRDFQERVPVRDYEGHKAYVERIKNGESDVLWKGKPLYFAKTSGTTSGAKYIPISKESMPFHISAARNAILSYIYHTQKADFVNGKMIFLQGNPEMDEINGIKLGRLSGIVAHYVPKYLQKNRMPSWKTNIIDDWETKVEAIVQETISENMTVISGIPSWVQMYFERLIAQGKQPVGKLFPNFQLFIYGGVNYEPYRNKMEQLIGRKVDSIELFPASEGFFAYQNDPKDSDMLLLLNSGIFYEFIKAEEFFTENPKRYTVAQVALGINYVLILSTNAGLWAYNIGDTVMFTSLFPHKIVVTGRIKHFISAFGEHVIGKEVEQALQNTLVNHPASVTEFTVAPQINPTQGLPYHEWLIEFDQLPENFTAFSAALDEAMRKQNVYYDDLISGKVLQPLQITLIAKNGFNAYMKSEGKLGGQNKIPRLSNDRKIADFLNSHTT